MQILARVAEEAAGLACLLFAGLAIGMSVAHAAGHCVKDPQIAAVDLSAPVDQFFLDQMKANGINTIIRYYDHEAETLPGKTLRRTERDLIVLNGFKLGVVFQHHNDEFGSFTTLRGRQDAERSLYLAKENAQLPGSAIYFGVDGGWKTAFALSSIMAYFKEIKGRVASAGYRVGVYGSGLVCSTLLRAGLAELCWLGATANWPGFHEYYPTKAWKLVQLPSTRCGGRSVDFDLANGADYGQFGY
ncbi:MAG: DUF1906 domain-containing protein [Alphaproteobacteria bacterium]|nr:DUF1906 domain-containing protein [Alphaproteobacteria bacterium]